MPFVAGSVMVWAGICGQERTPFVFLNGNSTAQRYIIDSLRPTVLPFLLQQPRGVTYQYDHAKPHSARIVQTVLGADNVNVLPWPECSLHMSVMGHLWDVMDHRV